MEKSENAVRSRLLEAGKEEFRDRGFLKASLRAICKKADVTTGAHLGYPRPDLSTK